MQKRTVGTEVALYQQIRRVFSGTPYPGDDQLVTDNTGYDLECKEMLKYFRGRDWLEIPLGYLRYFHDSLGFFTPAGFRFYLPAYLAACVRSYSRAENIPHSLVFFLTVPSGKIERRQFENLMKPFTKMQKKVIKSVLVYLDMLHGEDFALGNIRVALRKYWTRQG